MATPESKAPSPTFYPLKDFGAPIQQSVMPLVTITQDQLIPLGTGFMIARDGLMMTAGHVVDEAVRSKVRCLDAQGHYYDHYEFYALYITNERHGPNKERFVGGLWPIDKVWYPSDLDIAFCWLRPALRNDEPICFPIVRLSPALPAVGTPIIGFGYYDMGGSPIDYSSGGNARIKYQQNTAHTQGVITEVYPDRRDMGMLRFPSFQTDARFDHGMSGGPIFSEAGGVCGVICSSWPKAGSEPGYISYGSLIWPAFGASIEVALEDGGAPQQVLIHDLAKRGLIAVDEGLSKVKVVDRADGTRTVSIIS